MELFVLMLGMLLSFVAGAYVRQPFTTNEQRVATPEPTKELLAPVESKYMEQMNALWNYSERDALDGTKEKGS